MKKIANSGKFVTAKKNLWLLHISVTVVSGIKLRFLDLNMNKDSQKKTANFYVK